MSHKVTSLGTYFAVFAILVALTLLTLVLGFLELGPWHTIVGLTIAAIKATLVVLVFMHLLESPPVSWLSLGIGIFWLGILMGLTLTDYLTRHWLVF